MPADPPGAGVPGAGLATPPDTTSSNGTLPTGRAASGPRRPPRPPRDALADAGASSVAKKSKRTRRSGAATAASDGNGDGGPQTARVDTVEEPTRPQRVVSPPPPQAPPPEAVVTSAAPAVLAPPRPPGADQRGPKTDKGRRRVRRGRRVRRIVRRIELWSVLKLSLMVYTCLYVAIMATLAALWGFAYSSGSVDRLESFLADVGLENFHFYGDQMFWACAAIGAVAVIAGTVVSVLATALVNLISETTGGIRLVVIEEDLRS